MTNRWEKRKKSFDGLRLVWHGHEADEEFWAAYWQDRLSESHYEKLKAFRPAGSILAKALLQELRSSDLILEAGCGAGDWVVILNNLGFKKVRGIEYSPELVAGVKAVRPELRVERGNVLDLQEEDDYYDAYLSFGVVEHRIAGPEPFLQEAFRVLKPGGKAIFTVPCVGPLRKFKGSIGLYGDLIDGIPFFQYGFQPKEFMTLLMAAGFQVKYCRYSELDRLWMEESGLYRKLAGYTVPRAIQRRLTALLEGIDGHLLLAVCLKPGEI